MNIVCGRDIIIVGLQPWDTKIGSNCKNIAIEFSKYNRVLYVNSPLDRFTQLHRKNEDAVRKRIAILNNDFDNLEVINSNLWVYYPDSVIESINWIKVTLMFNILNRRNNRKFAKSILKAVDRLGFSDYILFNDNDIFRSFYLKEYLRPSLSVYYSRDNLLGVDYWRFHGRRLEPMLMAKSDICVANSSYLTSVCRLNNENSYDVGQGCEIEEFSGVPKLSISDELKHVQKPIIGYIGALQALRLDIELLEYIAEVKTEWCFVFVGPEDLEFINSRLHSMSNVLFLGSKLPEQLPLYINSFDVCINPQKINEVTIGNYPRKIDEYLAVGKPVVATLTDSMLMFSDYVYLAKSKKQYIRLIEQAMEENNDELSARRKQFASSHTWENSVKKIYDAILAFKKSYLV